jgi:hypothetical protein
MPNMYEMKKIKKQEIIPLILCVIFIASMFYCIIYKTREYKSLSNNLEYSNATIIGFSPGPRMRYYLDYKFFVEEKEYQGGGRHYPASDTLVVGDTIIVVYDKTNPKNNKAWRDY